MLFRIDHGGKNFKSASDIKYSRKTCWLARLMENDLANSRNSVNSNDVSAESVLKQ